MSFLDCLHVLYHNLSAVCNRKLSKSFSVATEKQLLSNGVCPRRAISGVGQVTGGTADWLICAEKTVNTFKELVTIGPSMTFCTSTDGTTVFEKGVTVTSGAVNFTGTSRAHSNMHYVLNGPVQALASWRALGVHNWAHVTLASTGNKASLFFDINDGTVACAVNDAIEDSGVLFISDAATFDFGATTHQKMRWLCTGSNASTGDIVVSGGRLEFDAGATWLNGTNITLRGTGTLKVGSTGTFRDDVCVTAEGTGWTLDLMGRQKAERLVLDGVSQPAGVYSATSGRLKANFVGMGALVVREVGTAIFLR